jgi:hypothetical protein
MFDAYTVKKVLPRLVVAVVLIQLSWFIFTGMITLTTAVAYGVQGLIYAPFGPPETFELDALLLGASGSDGIVTGGTGVFVALALAGGTTLGILGGALTLALGALLAILIGFALLMFRQVLVVALLIVSPLALVAWILPNTEKFWKIWWESFSKLLLVFPMIVAVVAIGRVFAYITAGVNPGESADNLLTNVGIDELITIIFVVIGFFGPFFMIPKLFALAGSAFTLISGGLNDRSRGAFDRLKKGRQQTQAKNWSDFKAGDRTSRGGLGTALNRVGKGVGLGYSGRFGFGARGAAAGDIARRSHATHAAKENEALQQAQFDDPGIAVLALSGGTREGADRASRILQNEHGWSEAQRQRALGVAHTVGVNGSTATAAIDMMAQNKSRMLTGSLAGDAGVALVRESAAHISHGNAQLRDNIMGSYSYHSRNAGRIDQGGEAGASLQQGWERTGLQAHAASQTPSLTAFSQQFVHDYHNGTQDQKHAAAIALMEMQAMLSGGATADNQKVINEALAAVGVDHNLGSVESQLAANSGGAITESDVRGLARVWDGQATGAPGGPGGVPAPPGAAPPPVAPPGGSDIRLKRNIHFLETAEEIRLYSFQYLWSDQIFVGVMAQDLVKTHPQALSKDCFGYYLVDYAKLGLEMMTIEEWQEAKQKSLSHTS